MYSQLCPQKHEDGLGEIYTHIYMQSFSLLTLTQEQTHFFIHQLER